MSAVAGWLAIHAAADESWFLGPILAVGPARVFRVKHGMHPAKATLAMNDQGPHSLPPQDGAFVSPVIDSAATGGEVPPPEGQTPEKRKRLSAFLTEIAEDHTRERVSISDLLAELDVRAFGAMLLIFALPNVLPSLPGTSSVLGLPLLYLTYQLMRGHAPRLPRFLAQRSMARADFAALVDRFQPFLSRAEKLLCPRLLPVTAPQVERVVGGLCLLLAVVLFLPIPLGNMLPAFAISVIALGILERDGVWILAGSAIGILSMVIVSGVIFAMIKAAVFVVGSLFA